MPTLSWLHISDIHLRPETKSSQDIVLDAFFDDLHNQCSEINAPLDFVFLTGDLAYGGKPREYKLVAAFLDRLRRQIKVKKSRIVVIPGNHDVNRARLTALAKGARSLIKDRESANAILTEPAHRRVLFDRFRDYATFIKSYFSNHHPPVSLKAPFSYHRIFRVHSHAIAVACINSACLSMDNDERHKLIIGDSQVRDLIPKSNSSNIKIALVHHPFSWLHDFDKADVEAIIHREFDFVLCGHLHETNLQLISSPDAGVFNFSAGALYGSRKWPNAYNIVTIDLSTRKGIVHLRHYVDKAGGHFIQDNETFRKVDNGRWPFSLSSIEEVTSPESIDPMTTLSGLAMRMFTEHGKRRTAYPTDMNFAELHSANVYVEPSFSFLPSGAQDQSSRTDIPLSEVLSRLDAGQSVLVLGDPGCGKSFLSFLVQDHICHGPSPSDSTRVCLILDIHHLLKIASNSTSVLSLLQGFLPSSSAPFHLSGSDTLRDRLLIILDGIDEVVSTPSHIATLSDVITKLSSECSLFITCRRRDYDIVFSRHFSSSYFDLIVTMKEWTVENEFAIFLDKLRDAGLLSDDSLMQSVRASPELQDLVKRPLHARMLTYVYAAKHRTAIADLSELYANYLKMYAATIDHQLYAENVLSEPNCLVIWHDCAWQIFRQQLFVHDMIPISPLRDLLVNRHDLTMESVDRFIDSFFNVTTIYNQTQAQFIHLSFYAYLVASYIADRLLRSAESDSNSVYEYFRRDLKREIRHHLVGILRSTAPDTFGKWLARAYDRNKEESESSTGHLIANNLLLYILGRLPDLLLDHIWQIEQKEKDPFLRTSLYWSLCSAGSDEALVQYLNELNDAHMSSLNRGYLMYYYGDIDQHTDPPYLDEDPLEQWSQTRILTMQLMNSSTYSSEVSAARRALDIYTFLDFCRFRNSNVSPIEKVTLHDQLRQLQAEQCNSTVLHRLESLFELCAG